MNIRILGILLLCLGIPFSTFAEETPYSLQNQEKIPIEKTITEMPRTAWDFLKNSFCCEAFPGWFAVLSTSVVLYHYDADIYEGTQRTGRGWGLSNTDKTRTVYKVGKYDILRLPSDANSAFYFLGDGWLHIGTAVGMFATGYLNDYPRPYNTGLQLIHGMAISTFFNQLIKRSTGREAPSDRTVPRGAWRPFPSPKDYDANTAKYDAVPSGHIMTSTLVFTIIRGNYPEHDWWLWPTEIAYLSILGFAMVNNGVHWASDYPLGIAIGYMVGKSSLKLGKADQSHPEKTAGNWYFLPGWNSEGVPTINATVYF